LALTYPPYVSYYWLARLDKDYECCTCPLWCRAGVLLSCTTASLATLLSWLSSCRRRAELQGKESIGPGLGLDVSPASKSVSSVFWPCTDWANLAPFPFRSMKAPRFPDIAPSLTLLLQYGA
jgi:hypothetical protein